MARDLRRFTEHDYEDACSYAKENPGLIVTRAHDGQDWIVGDRKAISANIARERQEELEEAEDDCWVAEQQLVEMEMEQAEAEEDQQRLFNEFRDEFFENVDPDDWNRSTEEGWFYDDENTEPLARE